VDWLDGIVQGEKLWSVGAVVILLCITSTFSAPEQSRATPLHVFAYRCNSD
jgi:hypothetical protein